MMLILPRVFKIVDVNGLIELKISLTFETVPQCCTEWKRYVLSGIYSSFFFNILNIADLLKKTRGHSMVHTHKISSQKRGMDLSGAYDLWLFLAKKWWWIYSALQSFETKMLLCLNLVQTQKLRESYCTH